MARKRNFDRTRHRGKPADQAAPNDHQAEGAWTHVKREPVKRYSQEERDRLARERGWKTSPPKISYTIKEACSATGLSKSTFYNLFREGKLHKTTVRGRTLISAEQLHRLTSEHPDV